MKVAVATPVDLDRIAALVNDAYRGSLKAPGWTHEKALLSGQRIDASALQAMIAGGTTILVLRHERDVVSCVALQPLGDDEWYLSMLAVDPDHQDSGVGKTMMEGAEAHARERGAQAIKLSVLNMRETLMAWYKRQGYVQTGAIEPFPYDDPTVGTPLRDDLTLAIFKKPLR